jgi:hypothetical protein
VCALINNGFKLMNSIRMREADAGALMITLAFDKFMWELGWNVVLGAGAREQSRVVTDVQTQPSLPEASPLLFVRQMLELVRSQILLASQDVFDASRNYPVYGSLMALR